MKRPSTATATTPAKPDQSLQDLLDRLETPEEYTRNAMRLTGGRVPEHVRVMIEGYESSYHNLYALAVYDAVRRQVDGIGFEDQIEQARRLRGFLRV